MRLACLLLLCLAPLVEAQSVKLPATVQGQPGAWTIVVPDAVDGGAVKWRAGPGLNVVPIDKLFPGQKSVGIVVQAPTGRYTVWAWNAKADVASDLAECSIVIGDAPPVPPGPVPPGPVPPVPPVPPQPVPTPDLQAIVAPLKAFAGKATSGKVARFYADLADAISKDTAVTTNAQLRAIHVRAQAAFVAAEPSVAGSLPGFSAATNAAMAQALGLEDGALNRTRAVDTFRAIAWAIGGGA